MSSGLLNSEAVKAQAHRLGFSACGLARPHDVPAEWAVRYEQWISEGRHGQMSYLQNHCDLRFHPSLLVPGVQTIVSVALSYHPGGEPTQPGLAWYAQGEDYHTVMRRLLHQLMEAIGGQGRCFVDTAPVLEKYWAWQAGLGFIGRHTQLVIPRQGSAFFLGELFCTQQADAYDAPPDAPSPCGSCRRCIEACPTGAIGEDGMDARRCLSYLTIESRQAPPPRTLRCTEAGVPGKPRAAGHDAPRLAAPDTRAIRHPLPRECRQTSPIRGTEKKHQTKRRGVKHLKTQPGRFLAYNPKE